LVNKIYQKELKSIVEQILVIKNASSSDDINNLLFKLDRLVYELYGLTEEEIRIVEGG